MKLDIQSYIDSAPNDSYKKFFAKLPVFETVPERDWNKNHVLGYFIYKFNEQYSTPYKFKYNSMTPSGCFELFQIAKLQINVSMSGDICKKYIDWFFDEKLGPKRILSVSAMLKENFLNDFKHQFSSNLLHQTIKRADELPNHIYEIVKTYNVGIKTYGDLAFLYASNKQLPIFTEINKIFTITELEKVV